jgi:hypothetical protein
MSISPISGSGTYVGGLALWRSISMRETTSSPCRGDRNHRFLVLRRVIRCFAQLPAPTCVPLPDNETCKLKQSLGLRSPSLSGLAAALERAVTTVGRGSNRFAIDSIYLYRRRTRQ